MKEIVATDLAPRAIGPYAQGVKAGGFVFFSGQIALDPATGEMVSGGVAAETERVMLNIEAALAAAGAGFSQVVKTTIFLTDLAAFGTVNEIYGQRFKHEPPARSTVQVAALPRGATVEIEVIACVG